MLCVGCFGFDVFFCVWVSVVLLLVFSSTFKHSPSALFLWQGGLSFVAFLV